MSDNSEVSLEKLIKSASESRGLDWREIVRLEFGSTYMGALARGAIKPSDVTLGLFARRLDLPLETLLAARQALRTSPDLAAVQVDFRYQANCVLQLIHGGNLDGALATLAQLEQWVQPYLQQLPAAIVYRIPFLRGRVYFEQGQYASAEVSFSLALALAVSDAEAEMQVRNMFGAIYYRREQPQLALQQHLFCLPFVTRGLIRDRNLIMRFYQNLALDFCAVGDGAEAVGLYKEALALLEDMDDAESLAQTMNGLMLAYSMMGQPSLASAFGLRALELSVASDRSDDTAAVAVALARIRAGEGEYEQAQVLLTRAEGLLGHSENSELVADLHIARADLARQQGQLHTATSYVLRGLAWAGIDPQGDADSQPEPRVSRRTCAEALLVAAMIADAQGEYAASDGLFCQALGYLKPTGLVGLRRLIRVQHAIMLLGRGSYEHSNNCFRDLLIEHRRP